MKSLNNLKSFLEELDSYRDKILFLFIKPYWPRKITPNHVTYIRVAIGIILFILLFFTKIENKNLIVFLFVVGIITDFIDGPIARGTNQVTEFGAMLDSASDRILIVPIAVYALIEYHKWLLLILILVEIANSIASMYYRSKEIYIESNIFGKIKMALMSIPLIVILIVWPNILPRPFLYMLWLTIPFSFLSAFVRILELKDKRKYNEFKNI